MSLTPPTASAPAATGGALTKAREAISLDPIGYLKDLNASLQPDDYGQMMPSHAAGVKASKSTIAFPSDKSADIARKGLAPLVPIVKTLNLADWVTNAAQAYMAGTGDKKAMDTVTGLVAQAMRNLPISQGVAPEGKGAARLGAPADQTDFDAFMQTYSAATGIRDVSEEMAATPTQDLAVRQKAYNDTVTGFTQYFQQVKPNKLQMKHAIDKMREAVPAEEGVTVEGTAKDVTGQKQIELRQAEAPAPEIIDPFDEISETLKEKRGKATRLAISEEEPPKKSASEIRGGTPIVDPLEENASGQTDVSLEAVREQKARIKGGIASVIIDSRSGKERPAIGIRPEDNTLNPYDVLVQRDGDGKQTIINKGDKAKPLPEAPKRDKESRKGSKGKKQPVPADNEPAAAETVSTVQNVDAPASDELPRLRPALRSGSDTVIGEVGSDHPSILEANPDMPENSERMFAKPDGELVTRDEGAEFLKKENPAVYDEWEKAHPGEDLHSKDMNAAVEKVEGKQITKKPAPEPNTILTQVNDLNGEPMGYEVSKHDGTPEGMHEAAKKNAKAMNKYKDASNNETIHLVIDKDGKPAGTINARFGDVTPLPPVPDKVPAEGGGVKYQTGKPVKMGYIWNTEKAPNMGERFGQHLEPAGRYINERPITFKGDDYPNLKEGEVEFKNPLVVGWGGGYGEPDNWKQALSDKYGGKKGKALSKALIKDGYDGIITLDAKGNTSEIVDLVPDKPASKEVAKAEEPGKEAALVEDIRSLEKKLQNLRDKHARDGRKSMIPPAIRAEQMKNIEKLADQLGKKQDELEAMHEAERATEAAKVEEADGWIADYIKGDTYKWRGMDDLDRAWQKYEEMHRYPDVDKDQFAKLFKNRITELPARADYEAARVEDKPAEVVDEAVQTAKKEGTPLKEQKKYLIANIDEAIKEAPEFHEDMEGFNNLTDHRAAKRQAHDDALSEKEKAQGEIELSQRWIDEGGVGEYKFTDVEIAREKQKLADAKARYEKSLPEIERTKKELAPVNKEVTDRFMVTIDVPGDGTFQVYNTKYALQEFKKLVEKLFPGSDKLPTVAKGLGPLPKATGVKAEGIENGVTGKDADNNVWHTNGVLIVKGKPTVPFKSEMPPDKAKDLDERTAQVVKMYTSNPKEGTPVASAKFLAMDKNGNMVAQRSGDDVSFQGISDEPIKTGKDEVAFVRLTGENGATTDMSQKFYVYVRHHYPDAEIRFKDDKNPINFVEDGKIVAVVMPVKSEGKVNEAFESFGVKSGKVKEIPHDDQVKFTGALGAAADTPQQLRPPDVDRVMAFAHDNGYNVDDLADWLISHQFTPDDTGHSMSSRTIQMIKDWRPDNSVTLDFMGLQQAYESLSKIPRAVKSAIPHLETLGKQVFTEGRTKYQDFVKGMKEKLGDLWQRFKSLMEDVWDKVRRTIKNGKDRQGTGEARFSVGEGGDSGNGELPVHRGDVLHDLAGERGQDEALIQDLNRSLPPDQQKRITFILADEKSRDNGVAQIGAAFGKRVIFYKQSPDDTFNINGIIYDNKTIFIRTDADRPQLVVLGHELLHSIVKDDAINGTNFYNDFTKALDPYTGWFERSQYAGRVAQAYIDQGMKAPVRETLFEEFYADTIGDRFADKGFWKELGRKSPSIVRRVMEYVKGLLVKLKGYFKTTDHAFDDISKVNDITSDFLSRYAEYQGVRTGPKSTDEVPLPKFLIAFPALKAEFLRKYNGALDKAEEAVKNRDEAGARKWLAEADALERLWEGKDAKPGGDEKVDMEGGLAHKDEAEMAGVLQQGDTISADASPRTTSIKNAVTEGERAARGLGPIEVEWRRSFPHSFEAAKRRVDSGEFDPRLEAKKYAEKPRALSTEEEAAFEYDRMRLYNDHHTVMGLIDKAVQSGDQAAILEGRQRLAVIEDDISDNDYVARRSGYEAGHSLSFRRMLVKQDYTLARSLQRARAATGEKEIPEDLRKQIETLTQELEAAVKKSQEYEEKLANIEAQRVVSKQEPSPAAKRREKRAVTREELDSQFKSLAGKLRASLSTLSMNFNPEQAAILGEMMKIRVQEGITKVGDIVDDIYAEFEGIPDVSKRDIRDAISNYGKSYQMSQEEIQVEMREIRRQMRLVSGLEDAQAGQAPLHSGLQRDPVSDEVRDLQKQIHEEMKNQGINQKSSEERWKTALDSVKTRLKNEIHDLDEQIAAGKRKYKDKTTLEYDEEAKRLKSVRDEKKALLDQIDAKPPKTEQELNDIGNRMAKARYQTRLKELQRMLDTGNYEKRARRVLKLDPEAQRLKAEVEKKKEAVDTAIRRQAHANRTPVEKGLDWAVKWRRAVILSSIQTVGKLTAAATMRQITTPIEDLIEGGLSLFPGLSRISAKAPREGGGLNVRAEAAAFSQWFKKQTWQDIKDVAITGRGELDRLYGSKKDMLPTSALDFFGRVHGALKVTPKRAEFYRSLQKRTEWAMRNGYDMSDPVTVATITADAYIDANRAIFMQDNFVIKGYRIWLNYLKTRGDLGKATAAGMQMMTPIVKIPTNFVAELTSYAFGAAKGSARVAFSKGIENLTPEEADYVMRAFKKQGLGLAMLAIGYFAYEAIGGYYQRGEKRKAGEVKEGELRLGKFDVPKFALHTPALEILQLGATIHRVQDQYAASDEKNEKKIDEGKKEAKGSGTGAGIFAGAKGIAEQVPFFEQPVRMAESTRSEASARTWANQFAESLLMPPDIRRISKYMDRAGDQQIPREQKEFWSQVMRGDIPGQRKNLPVDIAKVKKMQLDQLAEIMENAPGDVVDQIQPVFRTKFRRAHGLSDEERDRYLELIK